MDKSLLTNMVSVLLCGVGLLLPGLAGELVLTTGLYAVSGAVTNWMAIYMLFEKVPGFYGSGVIPARFTEFRAGIRTMMMEQFFNADNVGKVMAAATDGKALADAAAQRAVPLKIVDLTDGKIAALYERKLVLVRPDGHVAWRGDACPSPTEALAVIDRLRGAAV